MGLFIRDVEVSAGIKIALYLAAQNIFSAVERLFLTVGEGAKAGGVNFIEYSVYLALQLIAFNAVDLIANVLLILLAALKPRRLLDGGLGAVRAEKAERAIMEVAIVEDASEHAAKVRRVSNVGLIGKLVK